MQCIHTLCKILTKREGFSRIQIQFFKRFCPIVYITDNHIHKWLIKKLKMRPCFDPRNLDFEDSRVTSCAIRSMKQFRKKFSYIYLIWIIPDPSPFPIPHSAWREFHSTHCVLSPYPKGPPGPEKLSIFNFGYVKQVWIRGLLGVKDLKHKQ